MESEARVDGRRLRYQGRREELLAAALRYALRHGVVDLSMRPLAKELGVSQASFAYHFGSKEQLVTELMDLFRERTLGDAAKARAGRPLEPGLEPYVLWWESWRADEARNYSGLLLMYESQILAARHADRYPGFQRRSTQEWLTLTRAYLTLLGCPEPEVDANATMIYAVMKGLGFDLVVSHDAERIDAAHASFVALMETRISHWTAVDVNQAPASG